MSSTVRPRPSISTFAIAALAFLALLAALLSLHLNTIRFSSVDVAPLIDGSWRVFLGQAQGRDFIGTFPVSLNLVGSLAFRLFGVRWQALGLAESALTVLLCLLGLRLCTLLRPTLGSSRALAVATVYTAAQLIPLLSINYIWHASMAQQLACYAVLSTLALLSTTQHRSELFAHLLAALPLLLLSKPNTSWPAVLLCLLLLLRSRAVSRQWLLALVLAVCTVSVLLLRTAHTDPLHFVLAYRGLSGRLLPKPLLQGLFYQVNPFALIHLTTWLLLLPALAALFHARHRLVRNLFRSPVRLLAFGSLALGLLGCATNFDFKLTDTPLILLGAVILAASIAPSPDEPQPASLSICLAYTTLSLFLVALFLGLTRTRMASMGQWGSLSCGPLVPMRDPFFEHLRACPALPATLAEVDRTLASAPPHSSIFFGPQLEFLYARNRLDSPHGLPLWWDVGTSLPRSAIPSVVRTWQLDHFDRVILLHAYGMPLPALEADLQTHYTLLPGTTLIDVYQRSAP